MDTLFLIFMIFVSILYGYIQYDNFMKKHNKVTTGIVFDAEEMPDVAEEAWNEVMNEGLGV